MNFRDLLLPLFCLLVISACGTLRPQTDPVMDQKAAELALSVRDLNRDIHSSKGTGWVTLDMDGKKDKFRMAWAVQSPDRARITLLSSGIPVETIVADGKSVKFISHTNAHPPHMVRNPDPDLGQVVQVRIQLSEIVSLLLGQCPLEPFEDAWFSPEDPDDIILRKNGSSSTFALNLSPDGSPRRLARRDGSGKLVYEILTLSQTPVQGRDIPDTLLVRDRLSRAIRLTITQFIPNPPIKESVFILTGPGS